MVKIKLDKERHLKMTIRGMLLFEEKTGNTLFKGFNVSKMSFKDVITLMWCCLIHEDKELTYEDFVDMVEMSRIKELTDKCMACISESLAKGEDESPLAENLPNG